MEGVRLVVVQAHQQPLLHVLPAGMTITAGAVTLGGAPSGQLDMYGGPARTSRVRVRRRSPQPAPAYSASPSISAQQRQVAFTNRAQVGGGGDPTNPTAPTAATAGACTGTDVPTEGCAIDGPDTVNAANLTLAKTNGVATVNAGGTTTYTLTVGNTGNVASAGTITIVDVLPAGMTIAAGAVTLGGAQAANWTCTAAGQNITCTSATSHCCCRHECLQLHPKHQRRQRQEP